MPSHFATVSGRSYTAFIVDDDEAVRDSLKLLLESHGFEVEAYASTHEFLMAYRSRPCCCLILDQNLVDTTGLEFLSSAEWSELQIPVILMTGKGTEALRSAALRAGASAYFEKPLTGSEFLSAVCSAATTMRS